MHGMEVYGNTDTKEVDRPLSYVWLVSALYLSSLPFDLCNLFC